MSGKRYLFYDNQSGEILVNEARNRIELMPSVERVIEIYSSLSERNRETFDVIELEYGAYAQDFAEGRLIGVDLETKRPIFEHPNPENPDEPIVPPVPLSVELAETKNKIVDLESKNAELNLSVIDIWEMILA